MGCRVDTAEPAPTTYAQAIKTRGPQVEAGRRMAVNGVDRSSDVGVHGMLGPNRAGKTTLIRSLATIPRPKERSLYLSGHATRGIDLRGTSRELGRLPQEFGLHSRFTVREFVEYMAWLKEVPQADIPWAAQRATERVGLDGRADDRMTTLPEGILRRAGIAQAIVDDPRILLVDEPAIRPSPAEQRCAALHTRHHEQAGIAR
ncbi:MAG TPA: ATP-binding cassette domain-containing protein [Umezawaea sp.]|nr:ATP-binding cassette domain-containing protein [Umezawaea sp.]